MESLFSYNPLPSDSKPSSHLSNFHEFFTERFLIEAEATSILHVGFICSDVFDNHKKVCLDADTTYNDELAKTPFGTVVANNKIIHDSNLNTKYDDDVYNQPPNLSVTDKAKHNTLISNRDWTKKVSSDALTIAKDSAAEEGKITCDKISKKYQELGLMIVKDSTISIEERVGYLNDNILPIYEHPRTLFPLLKSIIEDCPRYGQFYDEAEKHFLEQQKLQENL
jgi:hypothetical protein